MSKAPRQIRILAPDEMMNELERLDRARANRLLVAERKRNSRGNPNPPNPPKPPDHRNYIGRSGDYVILRPITGMLDGNQLVLVPGRSLPSAWVEDHIPPTDLRRLIGDGYLRRIT
jgi:hypothetical protein